jgi:steroid delta-isomerase-like uncharacterized protein
MPNPTVAVSFFALMSNRRLDAMVDLVRDDIRFLFPKTRPVVGKERVARFFQVLFRRYRELHFTVQGVLADAERVAVHWTNQGITRTGDAYENEGVTWFEFEDGKISFISDFFKDMSKF